jgi:hypothetical protein
MKTLTITTKKDNNKHELKSDDFQVIKEFFESMQSKHIIDSWHFESDNGGSLSACGVNAVPNFYECFETGLN